MALMPVHCGASAPCCTGRFSRSPFTPCRVDRKHRRNVTVAVLQQDDPTQRSDKQLSNMRQYLENLYTGVEEHPVAVRVVPLEENDSATCWHFAYGANMNFETLSKRGVRCISRDPAMVVDPDVKMVFKHRGGEEGDTMGLISLDWGATLAVPSDQSALGVRVSPFGTGRLVLLGPWIDVWHFLQVTRPCRSRTSLANFPLTGRTSMESSSRCLRRT